jgi:hypothetical protein
MNAAGNAPIWVVNTNTANQTLNFTNPASLATFQLATNGTITAKAVSATTLSPQSGNAISMNLGAYGLAFNSPGDISPQYSGQGSIGLTKVMPIVSAVTNLVGQIFVTNGIVSYQPTAASFNWSLIPAYSATQTNCWFGLWTNGQLSVVYSNTSSTFLVKPMATYP